MHIISINGYGMDKGSVHVSVEVEVEIASDSVPEAIALVASALLYQGVFTNPLVEQAIERTRPTPVSEPVAPTSTSTEVASTDLPKRTRRTQAQMAEAKALESAASSIPEETTSRRRRNVSASPDPMPINDAEMSKAASNGADELVKLGEDGPGIIGLIVEDYGVTSVGDIAQDKRQAFIDAVATEVRLAKAEKAVQA
jgi:hypothetical protein